MTEEYFKRHAKAAGIDEYWTNRLWDHRGPIIVTSIENEVTEALLKKKLEEWAEFLETHHL